MPDTLLFGLLVISIFMLGLYVIINYINYRILRKFDCTISYLEMLIPFWNIFLIDKAAFGKPHAYYYFWVSITCIILLSKITKNYSHDTIIIFASSTINLLLFATPIALIAQNLGKNVWIYLGLMVIPSVIHIGIGYIVTTILMLVLAFDNSKPVSSPDEARNHNV